MVKSLTDCFPTEMIINRIKDRSAKIVVVGLGYVGLTVAVAFSSIGFRVMGVDIDTNVVKTISEGNSHLSEPSLDELVKSVVNKGLLKATVLYNEAIEVFDVVIICVPTPLKDNNDPDLFYLEDACKNIASNLDRGKLIIIASTLPPGCTLHFLVPLLERVSGLRCGVDFYLAYCPERILPGRAFKEFVMNAQLVGGFNKASGKLGKALFKTVVKGPIIVTDVATAEVTKLAENTFRDVNIALANEFALLCEVLGVDVKEVVRLANTHPRVNILSPGPGVGGSCLPKDPWLLLHPARLKGFSSRIIASSREANGIMPKHIVELVLKGLNEAGKNIEGARIAVLGTAYKSDVPDHRLSPSKIIIEELKRLATKLVAFDPYCEESFGAKKARSLKEAVRDADCVIIATDHTEFRKIRLSKLKNLMKDMPIVIDGRRILNPLEARKLGYIYYGVGYGKQI